LAGPCRALEKPADGVRQPQGRQANDVDRQRVWSGA
jgi:hypothetical protein